MFTDLRNLLLYKQGIDVSLVEDEQEDPEGGSDDNKSQGFLSPLSMKVKPFEKDVIADADILDESKQALSDLKEGKGDDMNVIDEAEPFEVPESTPDDFLKKLETFSVEEAVQRFRIRVKNNSIGHLHYFPEKWNGKV